MVPTIMPGRVCPAESVRVTASAVRGFPEFGQTEIRELGVAVFRHQDVLGLDVPVDDAGGMCGGQAVGHACQELDNLSPRALGGPSPVLERAAVDELGDQILTAIDLPTSWTVTMCGWFNEDAVCASR